MTTIYTDTNIRHMIRRDLDEIIEIERDNFDRPWTEQEFISFARHPEARPRVVTCGPRVIGYCMSIKVDREHRIMNLAVSKRVQRGGVGRLMIGDLKEIVQRHWRRSMVAEVRERNVPAQLFFQAMGFLCVCQHKGYYCSTDEDMYYMEWQPA